mmetsp:Transcript_24988/g.18858  ORF Transcript_24988/g.18858 Transcript_24988/m.18858 type:complete len:120 (+) Transcript_24988:203-562(+)
MFYQPCLLLTVCSLVSLFFFLQTTRPLRDTIPFSLRLVAMFHFLLLAYYSFRAAKLFQKHFDDEYGENFPSLKELLKVLEEQQAEEERMHEALENQAKGEGSLHDKEIFYKEGAGDYQQ